MENLKEDDTILERFNSKFQKEKCLNKESLKYYSNKKMRIISSFYIR